MHKNTERAVYALAAQKERLIKEAITHKLGDNWTIAELTGRGEFTGTPDNAEIFSFDGEELIHFYAPRTVIDHEKAGIFMRVVQDYRILYCPRNKEC